MDYKNSDGRECKHCGSTGVIDTREKADDNVWILEMVDDNVWTMKMADDNVWTLEPANDSTNNNKGQISMVFLFA